MGPVDDDGRASSAPSAWSAPATSSIDAVFVTPLDHESGAQIARRRSRTTPTRRSTRTVHLGVGDDARGGRGRPPAGHGAGRRGHRRSPTSSAGCRSRSPRGRPAVHDAATVARGRRQGRARPPAHGRFGLRTARVVADDDGSRPAPRGQRPPVFVKAVNYIPWQHFAEVGRELLRPRHPAARRRPRQLGRRARARAVAALLRRGRRRRHPRVPGLPAAVVLRQRAPRPIPGFVDDAHAGRSRTWRYLLHDHPSVVYYACHNEPLRMFVPTTPRTTARSATSASATSMPRSLATLRVDRRLAPRPRGVGHRRRRPLATSGR